MNFYNLLMPLFLAITVYADSWKTSLPVVIYGMIGIFLVIGVIVLLTYALNKAFSKSKKGKDKKDE